VPNTTTKWNFTKYFILSFIVSFVDKITKKRVSAQDVITTDNTAKQIITRSQNIYDDIPIILTGDTNIKANKHMATLPTASDR
jgi:hypothetical protein